MPFRRTLRALLICGAWAAGLGGLSYVGYLFNLHVNRTEQSFERHHWADISDRDASVVASDGLVRVYGQAAAAKIRQLGPPAKVSVAGNGRHEWRFRYDVPAGAYSDAQRACVFVWRQKTAQDWWYSHHIVVRDCAA